MNKHTTKQDTRIVLFLVFKSGRGLLLENWSAWLFRLLDLYFLAGDGVASSTMLLAVGEGDWLLLTPVAANS